MLLENNILFLEIFYHKFMDSLFEEKIIDYFSLIIIIFC